MASPGHVLHVEISTTRHKPAKRQWWGCSVSFSPRRSLPSGQEVAPLAESVEIGPPIGPPDQGRQIARTLVLNAGRTEAPTEKAARPARRTR